MNTIERPNRDVLNKALDIFRDAMRPFLMNALKRVRGKRLEEAIEDSLSQYQAEEFRHLLRTNDGNIASAIDIRDFPNLVSRNWKNEVFGPQFIDDMTVQNHLHLIVKARNRAAHPDAADMDSEYTRNALFQIIEVLGKINAPAGKTAVEALRDTHFAPPQSPALVQTLAPTPRVTPGNLKPWREVIPPNIELTQGTFEEAELAADLQQVSDGRASATSYGNPVSFFNQTYLTDGLRGLLVNTLKRLGGQGGPPVIQMKTGFGGGKTHSLIALYHLVNSIDSLTNGSTADPDFARTYADIEQIIQEAGWDPGAGIQPQVAVLVGTYLSPTDTNVTENGDPLNTLWGVMAYQLGGQAAYDLIGDAARRQDSAPGGDQLDTLFQHIGPCVILMDELVAYMNNAADDILGPNYTFMQALTESVYRAANVVLVVTLPESKQEVGGIRGAEILATLEKRVGRMETIWKPLETEQAFEVVRRRLFGNEIDATERDKTCEAFAAMYNKSRKNFPQEAHEQRYLERMKACYPIHPEIFDRLHSDWSKIHAFQRTRGVLRMLANCISRLYRRDDPSPLILPANLPFDDPNFANEFDKLLPGRWDVVFTEADSDNGRADRIDSHRQSFIDYGGAARRIARTVLLGSCPDLAIKGINTHQIHLGVMQPGHRVATYTQALTEMRENLYHFYTDDTRYYFHTEEGLNKVVIDRAAELDDSDLNAHLITELQEAVGKRRAEVVVCPADPEAVPDSDELRLVILPPDKLLPSRSAETDEATSEATQILTQRATAERAHRNALVFLAAKTDQMRTLRDAARDYLAWQSITQGDRRIDNLTGERLRQAQDSIQKAAEAIRSAIPKAYRWVMAPTQPDPRSTAYKMLTEQTDAVRSGDIVKSALEALKAKELLIDYETPESIQALLAEYVYSNSNHIGIGELWNMMTQHVYMPRLENQTVLTDAIKEGVSNGTFGYAEGYDAGSDTYNGMRFSQSVNAVDMNGLLVNPAIAGIKPKLSLTSLTPVLHEKVWDNEQAHIGVEEVWEMMPEYVDDSQLQEATLIECIEQGVPQGQFGYAKGYQKNEKRYEDLLFRQALAPGVATLEGMLVEPKTATAETSKKDTGATRIVAKKTIQGDVSLDDISDLRQEIIEPLDTDGGEVTVEITITAYKTDGFSQNIERAIKENAAELDIDVKTDSEDPSR